MTRQWNASDSAKETSCESDHEVLDEQARLERFMRAAEFVMRSTAPPPPPSSRSTPPVSMRSQEIILPAPPRRPAMRPMLPTLNDDGTYGDIIIVPPPSVRPASWLPPPPPPYARTLSSIPPAPEPESDSFELPRGLRPSRLSTAVVFMMTLTTILSLLGIIVYATTGAASASTRLVPMAAAATAAPGSSVMSCSTDADLTANDNATTVAPAPTLPPPVYRYRRVAAAPSDPAPVAAETPSASPGPVASEPKTRLDDAAKTANMLRDQLSSSVH
jgi:hypothetical protein